MLKSIAGDKQITDEIRAKVKELAYRTDYAQYRLPHIIQIEAANIFPTAPKESKTAETGRGGTGTGTTPKALSEMSVEEVNGLSESEFLKLSSDLGSKSSRFTGITRARRG